LELQVILKRILVLESSKIEFTNSAVNLKRAVLGVLNGRSQKTKSVHTLSFEESLELMPVKKKDSGNHSFI